MWDYCKYDWFENRFTCSHCQSSKPRVCEGEPVRRACHRLRVPFPTPPRLIPVPLRSPNTCLPKEPSRHSMAP